METMILTTYSKKLNKVVQQELIKRKDWKHTRELFEKEHGLSVMVRLHYPEGITEILEVLKKANTLPFFESLKYFDKAVKMIDKYEKY